MASQKMIHYQPLKPDVFKYRKGTCTAECETGALQGSKRPIKLAHFIFNTALQSKLLSVANSKTVCA